ncbi:phosphopentomutase-like isoform X2 [Corticium candelabrum]|nr:phosphopentomutase-like isoform X2 [Corticium candelabrum]
MSVVYNLGMEINDIDAELSDKIREWLKWDENKITKEAIECLVKSRDLQALRECLLTRMSFGTAGLRAPMGPGYSKMNDLTVIQTTQGLCRYLESSFDVIQDRGVIIGHDARHNSRRFAALAAAVFISQGVRVYLFRDIVPTPYVPFAVLYYGAVCGIMVTASHNPKEDNGYKVYWENGAQIITPRDSAISSSVLKNVEPWAQSWDSSLPEQSDLRVDPLDEVNDKYHKAVAAQCSFTRELNKDTKMRFTYTAMHGVGYRFVQQVFCEFEIPEVIPVKEQVEPDPDFPTVRFPNPEEGESALELSMKTAEAHNSTVILANDPDADRLAVSEKQESGRWHVFTGNEIGTLLGWWAFHNHKKNHPEHFPGANVYMLASTVSSKMLGSMAQIEGFKFIETLTGFKWMGNQTRDLQAQGKTVLFAFEEAIGFMIGTSVLDKDGVSAAAAMAELTIYLAAQGSTLMSHLNQLYHRYGFHISSNSYFLCYSKEKIKRIFDSLRENGQYPGHCGPYKILHIRDLNTGYDDSQPNKKAILPISESSEMITFTFENGCVATLRTSGTEPKIKYYTELRGQPGESVDVSG